MPKRNQKIKLSENLKLGIAGPTSQGALFKVGGVFFLAASIFLAANIYSNIKNSPDVATSNSDPKVLGAFDSSTSVKAEIASKDITYTVQKGDTLFNIAQNLNINWVMIASANNLKAPYQLKPGTVLQIPQDK